MKKKLKLALKCCSNEQGFAIPVAVGLGLVMILIGATMVMRAQGDQVTASAQKATTDSLGVSETGVTRVQSLLKKFPKMAQRSNSDWSSEYTRLSGTNTCLSNTQDSNLVTNVNNWNKVDTLDPKKGEFKIVGYTYTANAGTLEIEGRARSENGSTTTSVDNATTSLEVEIPVVPLADFPVPGLWAKNFSMGNNDVKGNVLVAGCSIPSGVSTANIVAGSGSLKSNPSIEYPPLPDLPITFIPLVGGITSSDIPNTNDCIYDAGGYILDNDGARVSPNTKICKNSLKVKVGSFTLPRVGDTAGSDNIYNYLLGKDAQGKSISLKGGEKLAITAGRKVRLYLQGNLDMSGRSQIIHNSTPQTNFQIYGSDGGTHYRTAGDTNTYTTTSITLSGNTTANMFIYAPEATAGVNGGGNATSTITGSVWVKSWNGSNANQLVITQSADWTGLPVEQPKRISSIRLWQRQQASN